MKRKWFFLNITAKLTITSSLVISSFAYAQENSTAQPGISYGDNPNLIKVLAVKAQGKVQSTAEKVGAATERGVAKIKPTVDNTWQNVKQSISSTEEVPIQRSTLSQSSAPLTNPSLPITATSNSQPQTKLTSQTSTAIKHPVDAVEPAAMIAQNQAVIPAKKQAPSSPKYNPEFSESEIKRQSIAMPRSSAEPAASTVQPKDPILNQANQPSASRQNSPPATPANTQPAETPSDKNQNEAEATLPH